MTDQPVSERFLHVRQAINSVDPEDLLVYGEDEYNPEARAICERLDAGEELSADLVRSVLLSYFERATDDDVARIVAAIREPRQGA